MSEELKSRLRRYFHEVVTEGRTEGTEELFHEDAVLHSPMGDLRGIDQIAGLGLQFKAALPDGRLQVEEILVDGDSLAYRLTGAGTHQGEFAGVAATGRSIHWTNNDIGHVRDGKITELWGGPDMFTIMIQMGAISPPAPAPAG